MPVVNPLARELVFKVVYYGPGLGGKTTSLQHLHATAKPEHRGKMVSLATPVDRTLYFDFLPIRVPSVRGMSVRLQLFTVPGQVYYNATRKLVLTGADGVVAVFDSQRARSDANLESLENLIENLRAHGRDLGLVPHVIQYNKRDLYDVAGLNDLEQQLNLHGAPSFATTATAGEGIYESLEAITRAVLEDFERRMPDMRGMPAAALELPEGGLVDALRRAENEASPSAQRSTFTRVAGSGATTSLSGEYRLSQLPEVDPGEAAARAAAGHPDELVPRARQTWPLPGAPDERRPVSNHVADPLPLASQQALSASPASASPASSPSAGASPAGASSASSPSAGASSASSPPAGASSAGASSAGASLAVIPAAPSQPPPKVRNGERDVDPESFDLGPASMREPDFAPRGSIADAAPVPAPAPAPAPIPPAGEAVPARVPAAGEAAQALSFEQLWPAAERSTVRELETAIVHQNHTRAIMLSEQLIARSLAGAASALGGTPDAPRDPFTVVLVLGIDRRRYLEYRTLVRDARAGRTMSASEALMAYALAIETRLSRLSLTG